MTIKHNDEVYVSGFSGTVQYAYDMNDDGVVTVVDVLLPSGETVADIPVSLVTVTKKAPPPEPPVGSLIVVRRSYGSAVWRRVGMFSEPKWEKIFDTDRQGVGDKARWSDFNQANVSLYGDPQPVS